MGGAWGVVKRVYSWIWLERICVYGGRRCTAGQRRGSKEQGTWGTTLGMAEVGKRLEQRTLGGTRASLNGFRD